MSRRIWAPVLSDDCKCRATNYGDHDGWHVTVRPDCPDHGDGRDESEADR